MDRKAAIISVSSSKDLVDKYKYLTCKDLGLKRSTIEQGLIKDDQKDRLIKRLKNEEQLKEIEYHGENQLKAVENLKDRQLKTTETSQLKIIKPDDYAKDKEGIETINKFIKLDNSID